MSSIKIWNLDHFHIRKIKFCLDNLKQSILTSFNLSSLNFKTEQLLSIECDYKGSTKRFIGIRSKLQNRSRVAKSKLEKRQIFHIRTVSKTLNSIKWKITEINFILQILIIFANIRKKVKNCFFLRHEKIVPTGNIPIKKQRTFFCICVFVLKCLQLIGWVTYNRGAFKK